MKIKIIPYADAETVHLAHINDEISKMIDREFDYYEMDIKEEIGEFQYKYKQLPGAE